MALPDELSGLMDADAYPHPCASIELIETHISWVLLTGDYAYKLKKPVRFSFLDFSTLKLREHFCREELRCNRAFAPEVYVAVLPVQRLTDDGIAIGAADAGASLVDWAVQMRQFDPAAQLDHLLDQGQVTPAMLMEFGGALAATHAALPRLTGTANDVSDRILAPVMDNFAEIEATGLSSEYELLVKQARELSAATSNELLPLFTARMKGEYVRECHGDLHLSNLVVIDDRVIAFDCLEFSANLRWIDTISDVAFLFMDCHERGRADLAYTFFNAYLDAAGDFEGAQLLGYFAAYRSMVRAKVAALRWEQDASAEAAERFTKHLTWARDWLQRPPGKLILMCGLSGAGKSWVAERLAPLLPATRLRSDVARKALAGLGALDRTNSPVGGGLYHPQRSDEVYAYLAEVAAALLRSGENVIVDATFIERHRRAAFLALAEQLPCQALVLYCAVPEEILRERVAARWAAHHDPSEATPAVLQDQLGRFESPDTAEPVFELSTAAPLEDAELQLLAEQLLLA